MFKGPPLEELRDEERKVRRFAVGFMCLTCIIVLVVVW